MKSSAEIADLPAVRVKETGCVKREVTPTPDARGRALPSSSRRPCRASHGPQAGPRRPGAVVRCQMFMRLAADGAGRFLRSAIGPAASNRSLDFH
jgi:hypothetical protein